MFEFVKSKGNKCHQRKQDQIPICVVTGLKHDDILFAHVELPNSKWVIQSASCTLQRFWTTSTATINIICPSEYANFFAPSLPTVGVDTAQAHALQPEDEICVWMGYVDQLFVTREELSKLMENGDTYSPHLMRVFIGVVDTIGVVGTDKGYKYSIQCRDRMRYLMDTHVSLQPFDTQNNTSYMNKALGGGELTATRSQTILRLAQCGVGYINLGSGGKPLNVNGLAIEAGFIQDIGDFTSQKKDSSNNASASPALKTFLPPDYLYNHGLRVLAGATFNRILDISKTPLFNIYTSRPPFNTDTITRTYTVEEQVPIEMIKFLSNQEIYPTEVFSSPIDGNYYYTPRAGDISGLNDSRRFHRTYFYRYQPPGVGDANYLQKVKEVYGFQEVAFQDIGDEKNGVGAASYSADITDAFKLAPDFGQAILNWKQDLTTLSMFTNYIISNNSPNNKTSQNTTNNVLVNMSARPAFLSGLPIAGRNKYIVDETISTITEATSVGINFARMHSKELRGSSMTINGDPSMTPGEILQVIGNPMYSHLTELPEILRERKAAYDYILKDNKNYQVLLENMKGQEENKDFSVPNPVLGSNSDLTNNIMQDPNMADANVTGRLVKNTKSALDVLAAPMDADYSTIIKEGAGDKVAVTYDSKPGETPVQQASAAIPSAAQNSTNTALSEGIIPESAKTFYTPTQTRYRITSPFGPRFLFRRRGFHSGIDLGTPMGVPILASRSGLVTYSDWMGAYGKTVVLKHSDGMSTLYGHMSVLSVSVGAQVTVGQEVGKAGSTGRSTGPHLHFEIRSSTGIRLNPVTYLSSTLASQVKSGAVPAAPTPAVTTASNTNTTPTPASTSSNLTPNQQNSVYEKYKKVAEAEGYKETYSDVNAQSAQQTTSAAFNKMKQAAASSGVTLNIVSSYRSIKDQTAIFEGKINSGSTPEQAAKFSAPPGYSQHHTGYAVDINSLQQSFDQTAAFGWLNNNAVKYGFVMSYPKNISTDLGANYEPWHFIYVGDETAMGVFKDYIKRAKDGGFDILRGDSILNALYEKALKANSSPVPGSPAAAGTPTTPPTPDYTSPEIKNPLPDELWRKSHFSQEPVSMYRVDAVKHEFNVAGKSGYTTEVVLFSLFGG